MATADGCDTVDEASGSTVFYDNICQPCENDGKILEAEGRCEDCDEYLCMPCFNGHTLPSITRHHVMTGKDQLNTDTTQARKDQCTQKCSQHNDEIIKYYCPTHSFLGCNACMLLNHTSCTGNIYIPDVAKDLLSSEEYSNYKTRTSAIEIRSQEITTDAKERTETINKCQTTVVDKLRLFKKEVIDLFETAEKEIIEESEKVKKEELKKQKIVLDKSEVVEKELRALTSPVEGFESKNQYCNMYIAIMKATTGLKSCENKLGEIDQTNEPHRKMTYSPNQGVFDEMISCRGIGKIVDEITQIKHDRDVNVKTQSDTMTCWITGSVMVPDNKLIITDCNNSKLKMIDTCQYKVVEELSISSAPWDVTATRSNEVAVTLPLKKKIAFVKTDGKLVNRRNIVVVGACRGVAYMKNTLVVTYKTPPKVEVMDMTGLVLRTIATKGKGEVQLNDPLFVVVHEVETTVYITDASAGKTMCLTYDGSLKSSYTDTNQQQTGMVVDSFGYVYVCDCISHTVYQITQDCTKKRTLITEKDVTKPYSISFCKTEGKFYIGMRDNDIVKVFKVI